ncbi:MAG: GntR family transcriptional regulator [Bryobacterales bacterium]|nr:GntR family transcriptional regulator [Bryobacterales bacterium]
MKKGPLRSRVVELLKDAIFSGRLEPGEALRELRLASELQVSQATVREALVQLEQLGLVVRQPNRSTNVTRFSAREIEERAQLRILLEAEAMEQAARKFTGADYARLGELQAALEEKVWGDDHFGRIEADLAFHRSIWEHTGNTTLVRILDNLTAPLFAFTCILRTRKLVTSRMVVNPHQRLIEAMRSGDAALMRERIREHIETSYAAFLRAGATIGLT